MKLAVIPARGGSKRIPRKNIKLFAGKPMIAYAIELANKSNFFDHVVVSTDDAEIAAIARSFGAAVPFIRPPELSGDHTGTIPVIAHAIKSFQSKGGDVQQVCCIYPCVPMIEIEDLHKAHRMLSESNDNAAYVFAVAKFPAAIQRALRRTPDGRMTPMHPENVSIRTQDLETGYFDAGQFYFGWAGAWLSGVSPHVEGKGLIIPEWRAVDIDTPEDWHRAELLFRAVNADRQG